MIIINVFRNSVIKMLDNVANNKRLAKNTILLYMRTLLTMLVALYTSRVILNSLGVTDYGIYSVVAGFVSMLTILSGSLSSSISRFITYELGKGDISHLRVLFTTSILIQISISGIVLVIGELLSGYVINSFLQIPTERIEASIWTYHCSLLVFVTNLIYVPYNASIIAHERMATFAYVGILDVLLKLAIALIISISPYDKLIIYSLLLLVQALLICAKNFEKNDKFCWLGIFN